MKYPGRSRDFYLRISRWRKIDLKRFAALPEGTDGEPSSSSMSSYEDVAETMNLGGGGSTGSETFGGLLEGSLLTLARVCTSVSDRADVGCCDAKVFLKANEDKVAGAGKGQKVKIAGDVVKNALTYLDRQPIVSCRVESFGRMCENFDELRIRWVCEMGFGGLLHLRNKRIPISLTYWLMTHIDPEQQYFIAIDGRKYRFSQNQVRWVLGIPKGTLCVPKRGLGTKMNKAVQDLKDKYGREWEYTHRKTQKVVKCRGIYVDSTLMEIAGGEWDERDEIEFKTIFLMLALHMVLCPVQGPRLGSDMLAASCCAVDSLKYDWCGLVIEKLMESVKSFSKRFNVEGFANGCGGCSIFLAIYYLDRLNRRPVLWGACPRLLVWCTEEIRKASDADRHDCGGDYGKLGFLDVAYGEEHPCDARDKEAPLGEGGWVLSPQSYYCSDNSKRFVVQSANGGTMLKRINKKRKSIVPCIGGTQKRAAQE